jgi:hypothetical protein
MCLKLFKGYDTIQVKKFEGKKEKNSFFFVIFIFKRQTTKERYRCFTE